jgi:hypothetical protein
MWNVPPVSESIQEQQTKKGDAGYPVRIVKSERAGNELTEVLAEHSTDGWKDSAGKVGK